MIVSGGAGGIDTAAQQGARSVDGDVVVISGRSLQGRAAVPDEVRSDPGLCWLTPYAPWSPPGAAKNRFAQRNAFIAAMADVVIAVCGGERSGTRHTIEAALRFGRPVVSLDVDVDDAARVDDRHCRIGTRWRVAAGRGVVVAVGGLQALNTLLTGKRFRSKFSTTNVQTSGATR